MAACASTQYWGRYHTRYPSFVSVGLITWNNGFLDCFASPGGSVIACCCKACFSNPAYFGVFQNTCLEPDELSYVFVMNVVCTCAAMGTSHIFDSNWKCFCSH